MKVKYEMTMKLKYEVTTMIQIVTLSPENDAEKKLIGAMRFGEDFSCNTNEQGELFFLSTSKPPWNK